MVFSWGLWIAFLAVAALSYLLGSLNFALILSRFLAKDDIRRHGSGNAGMTNILRTYGAKPAIATAAGDFLKAMAAVVLSRLIFRQAGIELVDAGYISGLFVLLGHLYPLYFKFKGGKGVMVSIAVIFLTNPPILLVLLLVILPVVFITRIVSLGSVLGAAVYPVLTYFLLWYRGEEPLYDTICAAIISLIIFYTHRENIKRLLNGTENRFGGPKK